MPSRQMSSACKAAVEKLKIWSEISVKTPADTHFPMCNSCLPLVSKSKPAPWIHISDITYDHFQRSGKNTTILQCRNLKKCESAFAALCQRATCSRAEPDSKTRAPHGKSSGAGRAHSVVGAGKTRVARVHPGRRRLPRPSVRPAGPRPLISSTKTRAPRGTSRGAGHAHSIVGAGNTRAAQCVCVCARTHTHPKPLRAIDPKRCSGVKPVNFSRKM